MMEGGRKKPMCKKCCTPMKGHKRGVCRPNPWVDHGDNHKHHGGHYEWETQRWNGSKWVPLAVIPAVVTAVAENTVVVETEDASKTVSSSHIPRHPPGTRPERDAFLASLEPTAEEPEKPKDEWKPLTDESMWNYYQCWQRNSAFVHSQHEWV